MLYRSRVDYNVIIYFLALLGFLDSGSLICLFFGLFIRFALGFKVPYLIILSDFSPCLEINI